MNKELNQEQVMFLAMLVRKELESANQNTEIGKRLFRRLSKLLFALTGKNH